ncbi:hypothetical protein [Mesorhizobium sp.]|uniref:Y-family DNA polymerase n=1 Tax=Mesorhizobium sp. TaxID=1871066 RepID=UPI00257D5D6C|nr:hypothetical protein [Mesorhizobium sp.]
MRKPETIERLYLDFDGFFASVEQQCDRRLRGRPVGVVPFEGTDRTAVIACSREAKAYGVKNVMPINEAKRLCPELVLVPQKPDLYRRAHNALLSEIETVVPIDTAKSIDELTCRLDEAGRSDPLALAAKIKATIAENVGPWITCTIGFAANRQLAKIACKAGKRDGGRYGDGLTIWRPEDLPAALLVVTMEDIPGVGGNMASGSIVPASSRRNSFIMSKRSICASFGAMLPESAFGTRCTVMTSKHPPRAVACSDMAACFRRSRGRSPARAKSRACC